MYSMTGYGKADYQDKVCSLGVEISSVNNRFLEFTIRLPREMGGLEPLIKDHLASHLERGKITVSVHYEDLGGLGDSVIVNQALAEDVYRQLTNLKKKYKLVGELEISHFLAFPDIFKISKDGDFADRIWPILSKTIDKAIDGMMSMRSKEGAAMRKDILARIKNLLSLAKKVEKLHACDKPMLKEKLSNRIAELLNGKSVDSTRLEEEVAFLVDRSDITEETVRFTSHLNQFKDAVAENGSVGKRLNFILQEMNREANTMGSKTANSDIAGIAVRIKEEIEKLREQVQNIE